MIDAEEGVTRISNLDYISTTLHSRIVVQTLVSTVEVSI